MSSHYKTLGLNPSNCTLLDIKRAYKRLALQHHPDKTNNNDSQKFRQICEAYHALLILHKTPKQRRGKNTIRILTVTLKDVFLGSIKCVNVERNVICQNCKDHFLECIACPFQKRKCDVCHGRRFINIFPCQQCNNTRVVRDCSVLNVQIPKGAITGDQVIYDFMSDEQYGSETGSLIFKLQVQKHPKFKRVAENLIYKMNLSLTESLCGFQRTLKTVDDRTLVISCDSVTKNKSKRWIPDEGLPFREDPSEHGVLKIVFHVKYPTFLDDNLRSRLEKVLPPRPRVIIPEDAQHPTLFPIVLPEEPDINIPLC